MNVDRKLQHHGSRAGRWMMGCALIMALAGCQSISSPFGKKRPKSLPIVQDIGTSEENASTLVREAETAVSNGSPATAVRFAELAVGAQPQNIAARRTLARAYVAAGRFRSAAQAYDDLAAAGERDASTWAALATLAAGQQQEALARLSMLEGRANESDLGLAFALAGETQRGIEILTRAANNGGSARVRQNLALALALDGQWAAARVTAQQDLSTEDIQKRTDEWMRLQELGNSAARAAAILGVAPAEQDSGRPDALAWVAQQPMAGPWANAPMQQGAYGQMANNGYPPMQGAGGYGNPNPNPNVYGAPYAYNQAPPAGYAPYGTNMNMPYPQPNSPYGAPPYGQNAGGYGAPIPPAATAPPGTYGPLPQQSAQSDPVLPSADLPAPAPTSSVSAGFSDNFRPARTARSGSGWSVQLGAYSEQSQLAQQWQQIQSRNKALKGREAVVSEARLGNGQKIYRLQINGYADRASAERLCDTLKAQGRGCFVRSGN